MGNGNNEWSLLLQLRKMKMKVTMVRISKLGTGGWLAEVIVEGEVVRSYECRTFKEAQEIE